MKLIIIDDEPNARETIKDILKISGMDFQVLAEAYNVKTGIEALKNNKPDILLLDIDLPDGSGFDILNRTDQHNFKLIFITAYDQYAIKAIKFSAFDYILKPVNPQELIETIKSASASIEDENLSLKLKAVISNYYSGNEKNKKLILKTSESINLVNISQIIRCESDGGYTTFFLEDKRKILVSKTIKDYEDLLTGYGFFRVHQSHIVNADYIKSYEKGEGGYLLMNDNSQVPVATRKKDELLQFLKKL
jgi:two-component system LytT family response regulator